jgi:hypothetical protein
MRLLESDSPRYSSISLEIRKSEGPKVSRLGFGNAICRNGTWERHMLDSETVIPESVGPSQQLDGEYLSSLVDLRYGRIRHPQFSKIQLYQTAALSHHISSVSQHGGTPLPGGSDFRLELCTLTNHVPYVVLPQSAIGRPTLHVGHTKVRQFGVQISSSTHSPVALGTHGDIEQLSQNILQDYFFVSRSQSTHGIKTIE